MKKIFLLISFSLFFPIFNIYGLSLVAHDLCYVSGVVEEVSYAEEENPEEDLQVLIFKPDRYVLSVVVESVETLQKFSDVTSCADLYEVGMEKSIYIRDSEVSEIPKAGDSISGEVETSFGGYFTEYSIDRFDESENNDAERDQNYYYIVFGFIALVIFYFIWIKYAGSNGADNRGN